ncbi:MAG: hypothetical protein AAF682_18230 [Planctomycetota bacterium]
MAFDRLAALLLLAPLATPHAQDPPKPAEGPAPAPAPADQAAPPAVDPKAEGAWKAITSTMRVPGDRAPIRSFAIAAQVVTRQGVQTNEFEASYRYKEPKLIRFGLGPGRETGRGPGKGDRAYWLKEKDQVIQLLGRDYKADRDLVRRMTSIAQNVLSFADPASIQAEGKALRERPPTLFPKSLAWEARRMTWLEFASPNFDLFRDTPAPVATPGQPAPKRSFRVMLGADPKTNVPRFVVLREEVPAGQPGGEPLLFALQDYRQIDGYLLPHTIHVRGLEPNVLPLVFREKPGQEIYVTFADLTPGFTEKDFEAK